MNCCNAHLPISASLCAAVKLYSVAIVGSVYAATLALARVIRRS